MLSSENWTVGTKEYFIIAFQKCYTDWIPAMNKNLQEGTCAFSTLQYPSGREGLVDKGQLCIPSAGKHEAFMQWEIYQYGDLWKESFFNCKNDFFQRQKKILENISVKYMMTRLYTQKCQQIRNQRNRLVVVTYHQHPGEPGPESKVRAKRGLSRTWWGHEQGALKNGLKRSQNWMIGYSRGNYCKVREQLEGPQGES